MRQRERDKASTCNLNSPREIKAFPALQNKCPAGGGDVRSPELEFAAEAIDAQ